MGFTLGVCGHTPASLPSHAASRLLCCGHLRSKTWSLFERSQPIPFHLMEFPTSIVEPFFPPLQGFWAKAFFGDWIKEALEDLEIPGKKRQASQSVQFQRQIGKEKVSVSGEVSFLHLVKISLLATCKSTFACCFLLPNRLFRHLFVQSDVILDVHFIGRNLTPPKKFNSSPLKDDGWKTILSILGMGKLSGDVIHHTAREYQEFSVFSIYKFLSTPATLGLKRFLPWAEHRPLQKQKNPTDVDGIMGI